MPLAVIALEFDPYLRAGELAVRLETVGIALAALVGLLVASFLARRYRDERGEPVRLPIVDVLLLSIAAVPGAVIGGRLGYGLVHADYYAAQPLRLLDPATGGFELGLAVVGGVLTGASFARTLGSRVGAWLQVIAVPLLVALGLGKVAGALGGTGQGAPWDGLVSIAYLGGGPWGSLDPSSPAWPSQVIEGLAILIGAAMLVVLIAPEPAAETGGRSAPPFRLFGASPVIPDGRAFFIAIWIWASLRLFVGFTWRDALVFGPLRADQLISLSIAAASAFLYVVYATRPGAVLVPIAAPAAPSPAAPAPAAPAPARRKRTPAPVDPDLKPVRKRKPAASTPAASAKQMSRTKPTSTAKQRGRQPSIESASTPGGRTIEDVLREAAERQQRTPGEPPPSEADPRA